ncbi:unnamed protein product [Bemisia tabaci]|uniref:Torsin-1A C-terminal domain-containing protein n=1 Tax=Bemisia tabaci TaxID=7038 RepID=A0A9P0A832_BEMTA|nr:PREDICTED: torsin-1A-like [Bemisia tabaci]CAH0385334.1 unnamed protein product [Bemisia tabaci]
MLILKRVILLLLIAGTHKAEAFFETLWATITGGEQCNKHWINFDFNAFQHDLNENLFGQPLVLESVGYAVKSHYAKNDRNQKPLVLSFHGMQGSGKNYVSDFIVKHTFRRNLETGRKSQFVHFFNGRLQFPLERHIHTYKYELEKTIKDALYNCPYSIFIFDEVDKIPRGVLDTLKPYLDYRFEVQGVEAKKAIFIFLSNTGSRAIMEKYLEYWNEGIDRNNLSLNDFDDVIRSGAFNEDGGLQFSDNIESNLIDHYIPFLPLEKSHVRLCILKELTYHYGFHPDNKEEIVNEVFKTVTFGPKPEKIFSTSGCKRISQQVATLVTKSKWRSKSEL